MENNLTNAFLEAVITFLKEVRKSEDIAALLMNIKSEEPSLLHDFIVELSLTANPNEEEGVGCYSIEHIEHAYNEFIAKGTTALLNELK